jgi:hypothetical protein
VGVVTDSRLNRASDRGVAGIRSAGTAGVAVGSMAATPGLAPGTRVQLRDGARLKGTVMPYQPAYSPGLLGLFPVRLDNRIWQTCDATDVLVLAPPKEADQCARAGRAQRSNDAVESVERR